jgi:dipeptidyl aminopeptidase/acylaminoacyl peptidase
MNRFAFVTCLVMLSGASAGAAELGPCQDVNFIADIDGSTQKYVLRLPADFNDSKAHNLLVGLHGGLADRWQYAQATEWREIVATRDFAAEHGMILVSPDYRGKYSWMGPKAEADVVQIINDLRKQYKIDKVFVCGASMGGAACLTFAVLHPDMVDGVASMNGAANFFEYENDTVKDAFGGTKKQIPIEYKNRSAEYWPERLTMPVGVTASGRDELTPPQSIRRLAEVLKKMEHPVMLIYREQEGHRTSYEDAKAILEFVVESANSKDVTSPTVKQD